MFGFQMMEIGVYDCNNNKVMQWSRTLSSTGIGCLANNTYKLNISCPPGNIIGSVIQ